MSTLLELAAVHKGFAEGATRREVLRGVDLALEPGESVALLGRSGSGKTTLLHLAAGLDVPDAGNIRLDGQLLGALPDAARTRLRRDAVGFIYQFFNLLPMLTVAENVMLPALLGGRGTSRARADALDLLRRVGLHDRADSLPERLSGGEQQRVAIARALVHRPRLVLADEPTGNLDAETGRAILALLEELVVRAGHGLLLVTHAPEAAAICARVCQLESGRLRDGA